jgi:hypothetical protein
MMSKHVCGEREIIPHKEFTQKFLDEIVPFYVVAMSMPPTEQVTPFERQFVEMQCLISEQNYKVLFPPTTRYSPYGVCISARKMLPMGPQTYYLGFFSAFWAYMKGAWYYEVPIALDERVPRLLWPDGRCAGGISVRVNKECLSVGTHSIYAEDLRGV